MATRFYLSSTAQIFLNTPTPDAGWSRTTENGYYVMEPTKDGSALTDSPIWAGGAAAANATALCRTFMTAGLAAGNQFTTAGTFKCYIRARESAANDNINRQPIKITVVAADGNTIQATLKALGHYGPGTTEWPTTATNRSWGDGDTFAVNYTTAQGDKLVIEVGGQVSSAGGTTVTGNLRFGSAAASDLAENETGTTDNNPWFEVSNNLVFEAWSLVIPTRHRRIVPLI